MIDPDKNPTPSRNDFALWSLIGLMALIVVGGLVYGLSYPSIHARAVAQNSTGAAVQTDGSGTFHSRPHLIR